MNESNLVPPFVYADLDDENNYELSYVSMDCKLIASFEPIDVIDRKVVVWDKNGVRFSYNAKDCKDQKGSFIKWQFDYSNNEPHILIEKQNDKHTARKILIKGLNVIAVKNNEIDTKKLQTMSYDELLDLAIVQKELSAIS
jgi:hypothetical protein